MAACESVNTFPVLADPDDTAILGRRVRPARPPALAPESLGNLFDNTEIEEALLLHVHALSDAEREEIEEQDPAVREMVERAEATTPEEIMQLHGRLEEVGPRGGAGPPEPGRGRDGRPARGDRPARAARSSCGRRRAGATSTTRCWPGRTATVERIYLDYDDQVHVGVTVDGDAVAGALPRDRAATLLQGRRGGARLSMSDAKPQILVAGVGNAWMQDDGFGGKVVEALERPTCRTGSPLLDFGTGGLDLAYEVMRGYDALILVDVSRQGGEPGTLYVMDPTRRRSSRSATAR